MPLDRIAGTSIWPHYIKTIVFIVKRANIYYHSFLYNSWIVLFLIKGCKLNSVNEMNCTTRKSTLRWQKLFCAGLLGRVHQSIKILITYWLPNHMFACSIYNNSLIFTSGEDAVKSYRIKRSTVIKLNDIFKINFLCNRNNYEDPKIWSDCDL